MPLFNKTIINVYLGEDDDIIKLLREIKQLLTKHDEKAIQEIIGKLNKAIADIKSTV
jgi:hypothetical protein